MIAHIEGQIVEKFGNSIIVDVHGVGYEITIPTPDFESVNLNEERKFFTYHSIRENAEELYGFSSLAAKKLFELLISVQGIGPKAGIAILSLAEAVVSSDVLVKICTALDCTMDDIVEIVQEKERT